MPNPEVEIESEDYRKALEFVLKLYYLWGGARGDFRSSGQERDLGKYIHDHIGGKLAEIGVQKIFGRRGKRVKISFEQFQNREELGLPDIEGVYENGNLREPRVRVEIKDTKPTNAWWTIPWHEWTGRPKDAYVFVHVDLPLDHLVRYFRNGLEGMPEELLNAVQSLSGVKADVAAVYYRRDLESKGGHMHAEVEGFFDADNLFEVPARPPSAFERRRENVSELLLRPSQEPFRFSAPVTLLEAKIQKRQVNYTKYVRCSQDTIVTHPVAGQYQFRGLRRINEKVQSALREDNFLIHRRNLQFDEAQFARLIEEI
jgi:hypothetical protein